jgi:Trypsin-like peptidase domain/FHA domain
VKVVVEIVGGARAGRRLEFVDPTLLRVGRHPDCEVAFDPSGDIDASSRHAEVRLESDGFWLYDLGSANGTLLGGEKVTKVKLEDHAEVQFGKGGPRCVFHLDADTLKDVRTPVAESDDGRMGPNTVARMIKLAMAEARRHPSGVWGRSAVFARGMAGRASPGLRILAVALGAAVVGLVVALALVLKRSRPEEQIRRELLSVMDEQRQKNTRELDAKLAELNKELARARAAHGGRAVAEASRDGVYLVAVRGALGQEDGFCTAFAVAEHELATNAHCVVLADSLRRRGGALWAIKNGDGRTRFAVSGMKKSAGYVPGRGAITPDVGLLHVEGTLPARTRLAEREALEQLRPGDVIYTYGFPGRLSDTSSPEATFVQGVVGRITRLDGEAGTPAEAYLIQHSAFTAGGTSGSPIFDGGGRVVAVNAGGYVEDDQVEVRDPRSGKPAALVVAQPLSGYNFGMRIDLLQALLKEGTE